MSDFFENNQEITEEMEESTIFSAPAEHKRKAPIGNKKRLLSIIAAVLSVAILVGGTITVIKFIPKLTVEETVPPTPDVFTETDIVSNFMPISSDAAEGAIVSKITIDNAHGNFVFVSKQAEKDNPNTLYWTIEGVDYQKLSITKLADVISAAGNIKAVDKVDKSLDECGFSKPKIKCVVEKSDNTSYTLLVGNEAPGGLGYYMTVDSTNDVYVAREYSFENFEFSLLDLSDTSQIPKTVFSSDTSGNIVADGTYAYFDSLTLSGKLYPETITIVNNKKSSKTAGIIPYLISTPTERYANAEAMVDLVNLFSKTTAVTGNCAMDVNDDTLKLFGLDNPDAIITMTINGEAKTFKFSKITDESGDYCAIVYDGATMIRKGDIESFDFLTNTPEAYYFKSLFMTSINDVSNLTIKNSDTTLSFDIDNHDGTASTNNPYIVTINGNDVSEGFSGYYSDFTTIQYSNFEISKISSKPDATITFTFNDRTKSVVSLYLIEETAEYQCNLDGIDMGRITSAEYNKIIKNFGVIAAGGSVAQ